MYTKNLLVMMEPQVHKQLRLRSWERDASMSQVVRALVLAWLSGEVRVDLAVGSMADDRTIPDGPEHLARVLESVEVA